MLGHRTQSNIVWWPNMLMLKWVSKQLRAWTNDKCLATKHHQTLFGDQTFYRLGTLCLVLFDRVWSWVIVFDRFWSCLIKFEGRQTFDQKLNNFFCSRVGWAMFCSFGQLRIKHVWCGHAFHACPAAFINCLICVWSKMFQPFGHSLSLLGHQTMFDGVWSQNISRLSRP